MFAVHTFERVRFSGITTVKTANVKFTLNLRLKKNIF
jgi:hypothetical protein